MPLKQKKIHEWGHGDINFSILPSGMGGNGEFVDEIWEEIMSEWEEGRQLMSPWLEFRHSRLVDFTVWCDRKNICLHIQWVLSSFCSWFCLSAGQSHVGSIGPDSLRHGRLSCWLWTPLTPSIQSLCHCIGGRKSKPVNLKIGRSSQFHLPLVGEEAKHWS